MQQVSANDPSRGDAVKTILGVAVVSFCVALAIFVGYRMSAEAMAVVIGVVCGVVAGVPMSALILLLTQWQRRQPEAPQEMPQWMPPQQQSWMGQRGMPPVIVIQGGQPAQANEMMALQAPMMAAAPREFRVIGETWDAEMENSHDSRSAMVR